MPKHDGKQLVGHHLMRTRIRKQIFDRMEEVAMEQSEQLGEHVTVSDIVRAACYNYLLIHDTVQKMEAAASADLDDGVIFILNPTL